MAEPTATEILAWALINRARLDPTGEAARYGIDLNEGPVKDYNGNVVTITATSKQPLAWNSALHAVADQHSADMLASQQMYHNSIPVHEANLRNAGYSFSWWGENVARQPVNGNASQAIYLQHQMLFIDPPQYSPERGHRLNILSENFQEVGVGEAVGNFGGVSNSITTQDFGKGSANTQFLTGISYNDTDQNNFYSLGEGRGGVTVTTTTGNAVSGAAGAFSKSINAGVQTISFSGGGLPQTVSAEINVTAGRNALVDLVGTSTLETSVSLKALSGVIKIVGLGNIGLTLTGNALDNTIVSALGADTMNGGDGIDTAVFSGNRGSYVVNTNVATGITTVTGFGVTDTLSFIEKLQFADQLVTLGGTPANRAPVATISDKSLLTNQTANLASWVSYSDADGDAAVQYQIIDNGTAANSGALIGPNGAAVAAGTTLTVTAAQLASVLVRGGSVAGSETMQIRAFDGKDWGAWDSFVFNTTAPAIANRAPVVTVDDKTLKVNQWAKAADWLKYSDADGNAAVQYQFVDKYAAATSGYLWAEGAGQVAANQVLTVNASDIGNVWVRGAQGGGWEDMQVRVFDGTDWSAWDTFRVTTLPNAAPVATINDLKVKANQWLKVSDVLAFSDKNGDAAVQYQFMDLYDNAGGTSGYFWTPDNAHHAANAVITVDASEIGDVWIRGAQGAGWENMQVRVFDGMSWGAWDKFKITTVANVAPVTTMPDVKVSKNEWVQASTLLKTTDANGDAITQFQFVDQFAANGSAYFYTPDNPHHAGNEVFTVNAADLKDVWIRGGEVAGWDNMQVRAFDGEAWGSWDSFKFTTIDNSAPVVTADDIDLVIGLKIAAKSLFSVIDLDAKDKMTQYQFFDDNADADSGFFSQGNKIFGADTTFTVTSANLAKLNYTAGSEAGTDLLWVRAFDGDTWSDWHKFDANTIV